MSDTRSYRIGTLSWTTDGDTWHAAGGWRLVQHRRRDGHVSRDGWYLRGPGIDDCVWAGSRTSYALAVATLLALGEWDRTGLRDLDGTPTWRSTATGEVRREPEVLAEMEAAPAAASEEDR
jgi:hypothetical protein